jgi:hypothetical protein
MQKDCKVITKAKNDIPKVALDEVEMISYPKIQSI